MFQVQKQDRPGHRYIKEDAEYEGVRARFQGTLSRARIEMQIDIGFGDVVLPKPAPLEYPAILEFPAPVLLGYPRESVIAEKLQALTALGILNIPTAALEHNRNPVSTPVPVQNPAMTRVSRYLFSLSCRGYNLKY